MPLDVDTGFCIVHINIYADGKTHEKHNIIMQLIINAHCSFIKSKLMSSNYIFFVRTTVRTPKDIELLLFRTKDKSICLKRFIVLHKENEQKQQSVNRKMRRKLNKQGFGHII